MTDRISAVTAGSTHSATAPLPELVSLDGSRRLQLLGRRDATSWYAQVSEHIFPSRVGRQVVVSDSGLRSFYGWAKEPTLDLRQSSSIAAAKTAAVLKS